MPNALFHWADARALPLPDNHVDITIGSPPYFDARTYGVGDAATYEVDPWIQFMVQVTKEALRVTRGLVVWVCAGKTQDGNYWAGCEGLSYTLFRMGVHQWRPAIWYKVDPETGGGTGIPGSGGKQGLRADTEYCLIFKKQGPLPYANPTVHGHAPLFPPGGKIRNRAKDGSRAPRDFNPPKLTNPGNVIKARVGGGHMGDEEIHENEAPFPEGIPAWWIKAYCPPGGTVLDPFSGSGTTVCEAVRLGCDGIGFDLRYSQVLLGRRRLLRRIMEGRA